MTIEQMRILLKLPADTGDSEVIAAFGAHEREREEAESLALAAAKPADPRQLALDAIFNAPGSVEAEYDDAAGPTTVRLILSRPDQTANFGDGRVVQATMAIEVRRSEVAQPARGDVFIVGEDQYQIINEPMLDVEGLSWTFGAEPL